jgi:hypothetical protein
MSQAVEIVLCIPGPWRDRAELVERIVKDSDGYIFAGMVLMNMQSKDGFKLEFEGSRDERMLAAFEAAGPHWKSTPEMERIALHQSVVYLISNGGSIEAAHCIMEAANGLLKSGGMGVKVESTGLAHSPASWDEQCKYKHLFESHSSYVVYIFSDQQVYSCGMHNFGLPEAIMERHEAENPAELLRRFTHYLLSESPEIKSGQTFSVDADSPIYQILEHPGINYGDGSLFNNPYGAWKLRAK